MTKTFISAILAGLMISLGSIAYLNEPSIFGCLLFSVGLLAILDCQLDLFTGKVSYITSYKEFPYILIVLLGNILGCSVLVAFPSAVAKQLITDMLKVSMFYILIESILCNILIYIAVEAHNKHNIFVTVLSVTAFVASGLRHSIATICMTISARMFSLQILGYLLLIILGNAIGGITFHYFRMRCSK